MVSFLWNFMAEAALRSLPPWVKVFVIHVCKNPDFVAAFRPGHRIRRSWSIRESCKHGTILDAVFAGSFGQDLLACDKIVFLDHDCWYQRRYFTQTLTQMFDALDGGAVLAAHSPENTDRKARRIFETRPMFACKPVANWPASWLRMHYKDTGQWIAESLLENNPRAIALLPKFTGFEFHWTNDWLLFHDQASRAVRMRCYLHYQRLAKSGLFHPSEEELEMMEQWHLLRTLPAIFRRTLNKA